MNKIISFIKVKPVPFTIINLSLLFCLISFNSFPQSFMQIGVDIDGESAGDWFGRSLIMPDANTIGIGAPRNDGNGPNAGHVRIYSWNGNAWIQKGTDIDGEAADDESGTSISMPDANTVAIGATRNDGNGTWSGQVRIYSWIGSAWVQKGADIDGETVGDFSGWSICMPDANTVAIGAEYNNGGGTDAGHVRIYSWNGNAWIQKGVDINGEAAYDYAGSSVSMPDANTIAIGARGNDGGGLDAGHVRIYSWNGNAWVQKGTDIEGEAADDWSGWSVNMPDANMVAIGAPRNDGNGSNSGHVRIYSWNGNAWVQKGADIDGEAPVDHFGHSVFMPDTNTIAIGAPFNNGNGNNAGHVRIFRWNGSDWIQKGADIDGEAAGDWSGAYMVSMPDTSIIAIGAPENDGNGISSGHVRIYKICFSTNTISPTACDSFTSPSGKYTWSSSGTYMDTIPNTAGCDSIISINLTIFPTEINNRSESICKGDSIFLGGTYQYLPDVYLDTLNTIMGCDSIIITSLSVYQADTSITFNNGTYTANISGASYRWLDCNNGYIPIPGETGQSFTPSLSGSYAVEITDNGCTAISDCYSISVGMDEPVRSFGMHFYPNPATTSVIIELDKSYNDISISISNIDGRVIYNSKVKAQQIIELKLPEMAAGTYILRVGTNEGIMTNKFIKMIP